MTSLNWELGNDSQGYNLGDQMNRRQERLPALPGLGLTGTAQNAARVP
jgi:hypothetical protein